MKKRIFLLVFLFGFCLVKAQKPIALSTDRTVSLSFPAPVAYVDLGSDKIDARLIGAGSKVVLVKALEPGFSATNLTVVTIDDAVYSLQVLYSVNPEKDHIQVVPHTTPVSTYVSSIMDNGSRANGMVHNKDGLYAQVQGIYVHDSLLFFHLKVTNNTSLSYGIEAILFSVKSPESNRRVASQQRSVLPHSMEGTYKLVPQSGDAVMVAVLPKVSLSGKQLLIIELLEREGSRNLMLKIPARKLAHAIVLPTL